MTQEDDDATTRTAYNDNNGENTNAGATDFEIATNVTDDDSVVGIADGAVDGMVDDDGAFEGVVIVDGIADGGEGVAMVVPVSDSVIAPIVRRLVDACTRLASLTDFDTSPSGRLGAEILACFDVPGVVEAFVAELALPTTTATTTTTTTTNTATINTSTNTITNTAQHHIIQPVFRLTSAACSIPPNLSDAVRRSSLSPNESDRVLKTGQILVCSFPKQNRFLEMHMNRLIPSLMRIFEPESRGIRNHVL
ncbi:hypothetical protein HK100_012275 [Physocladia obscura]|uniref:Uncharacterized protein n=1 Tax=Physocladia obscura TaxID=109957 RepID=A0AAD5T014_9FUNG|nr:hypothetical protein HK100_012275 [Physocladia obscura]